MAKNAILDKAEAMKLDRAIAGPESIAIRGDDIYTGLLGEGIVKISKSGKVENVVMFGKNCGTKCIYIQYEHLKLVKAQNFKFFSWRMGFKTLRPSSWTSF